MFTYENYRQNLFILVSFLLIALATIVQFYNQDLWLALRGFSALDFANSILFPENFLRDYPGGAVNVQKSTLPWIYPFLLKFGVSYNLISSCMIFLEIATLCCGAIFLLKTLTPQATFGAFFILISLLSLSWIRVGNLANFGNPVFHGQFYGFADGLGLIAIATGLRKKYALSSVLFMFSFTIHPIITAFAFIFFTVIQLATIPLFKELKIYTKCVVPFIIFAFIWYPLQLENNTDVLNNLDFFNYSYIYNSHWYPYDLKIFTVRNLQSANAFFGAFLIAIALIARDDFISPVKNGIFWGLTALFSISLIGCAVASFELSPFLIKACLQRSSVLLLTIVTILVSYQFVNDLYEKKYLFAFTYFYCMVSAFAYINTWPPAAIILNLCVFYWFQHNKKDNFIKKTLLFLCTLYLFYQCVLISLHYNSFLTYYYQILSLFKAIIVYALILFILNKIEIFYLSNNRLKLCVIIFIFTLSSLFWSSNYLKSNRVDIKKSNDYKQVQLWAERATKNTALFMTDPSYAYGWREFSKRSSFGTLQEWLKTSWLYSSNNQAFIEGKERALMLLNDKEIIPNYHSKDVQALRENIKKIALTNFYNKEGLILAPIIKKYKIDYVVFDIQNAKKYGGIPKWKIAFKNQSYTVLKTS